MEDMIPCPVKDQEVFQRVWQRVMAGRSQQDSPIQPNAGVGSGDLSCDCLEALVRRAGEGFPPECERQGEAARPGGQEPPAQPSGWQRAEEAPAQETAPEVTAGESPAPGTPAGEAPAQGPSVEETPVPETPGAPADGLPGEDGPDRGNDLPQLWEEPQPSDDRTARLRRHVMEALEGWQFYRHLARRARGTDARTLNNLAGELHKHARKLSAAYFLLTGLRYWPTELLGVPAIPSYWGALRLRHQGEQRQENAYRLAADDWEDPDLLALYGELADACQRRGRQLRGLLEQGIT